MRRLCMDHSGYGLSQWETTLHCNVVSLWLSPYPEWTPAVYYQPFYFPCVGITSLASPFFTRCYLSPVTFYQFAIWHDGLVPCLRSFLCEPCSLFHMPNRFARVLSKLKIISYTNNGRNIELSFSDSFGNVDLSCHHNYFCQRYSKS